MEGFNYEEMVQEGLRTVVREALEATANEGLPGAHHFYIAFKTDYPGVQIPDWQASRPLQRLASSHADPFVLLGLEQVPVWGLQVPESWH